MWKHLPKRSLDFMEKQENKDDSNVPKIEEGIQLLITNI